MTDIDDIPDMLKESIRGFVLDAVQNGRNASLNLDVSSFGEQNETMLANAIQAIARKSQLQRETKNAKQLDSPEDLPKMIRFPYSRHASYPELCHLVSALKPRDVWPCTVSPADWIKNGISIEDLFGQHCSGTSFRHDIFVGTLREAHEWSQSHSQSQHDTQNTSSSFDIPMRDGFVPEDEEQTTRTGSPAASTTPHGHQSLRETTDDPRGSPDLSMEHTDTVLGKRDFAEYEAGAGDAFGYRDVTNDSQDSADALQERLAAFEAVLGNARSGTWQEVWLLSTNGNHTLEEKDLGVM
jgi:DNA cross-link repair 1C protein